MPGYPALWLSGALSAFAVAVSLVAVGWTTLQVSDSVLTVGATFAARFVPALVLGIPLGSLVDRFDRRLILVGVGLVAVVPLVGAAVLAGAGQLGLPALLGLSLGLGVLDTIRGTASQAYAFDLAGAEGATNAIALGNLGAFLLGTVGSVAGGVALEHSGIRSALLLAAAMSAAAGIGLAVSRGHARRPRSEPRPVPRFARSLTLITRNRLVALIALVVIVAEVLGFSSLTVFPTFARDVLHSDATGLGALSAARNLGAIAGLVLLARLGVRGRGGRLILLATLGFGLGLVGFALSTSFALSFVLLLAVGASAAGLDTLAQSLLQQSVDDSERGSAMGIWFFAIGFGPLGHLGIGAAANAFGAPTAMAISGSLLVLLAVALSGVRTIRRIA
ncbi:MAG: MFS transporter [Chloroflexota bacterium]|nr:MFS transporter [Chloroflexota bacterium]